MFGKKEDFPDLETLHSQLCTMSWLFQRVDTASIPLEWRGKHIFYVPFLSLTPCVAAICRDENRSPEYPASRPIVRGGLISAKAATDVGIIQFHLPFLEKSESAEPGRPPPPISLDVQTSNSWRVTI